LPLPLLLSCPLGICFTNFELPHPRHEPFALGVSLNQTLTSHISNPKTVRPERLSGCSTDSEDLVSRQECLSGRESRSRSVAVFLFVIPERNLLLCRPHSAPCHSAAKRRNLHLPLPLLLSCPLGICFTKPERPHPPHEAFPLELAPTKHSHLKSQIRKLFDLNA
jgi:hypothetical protein